MEEPSQMTQPQGSPIRIKPLMFFGGSPKVKGSFLHKAAEAEKAVQNSSPKKVNNIIVTSTIRYHALHANYLLFILGLD